MPSLLDIKHKITFNLYQSDEFTLLKNHFDLLKQAVSELLTKSEYTPLNMATNFLRCIKTQVYNDYWNGPVIDDLAILLSDLINTYPEAQWDQAIAATSVGSTGMEASLRTSVIKNSIHKYGNSLLNTFVTLHISGVMESLYYSSSLISTPETGLNWSTPTSRKNVLSALHELDSIRSTSTGQQSRLSMMVSHCIPALYDNLKPEIRDGWTSFTDTQQAWHLFFDLMLFDAITSADSATQQYLQKSPIMSNAMANHASLLNLPLYKRDSARILYLTDKYQGLIPESQLSHLNTYLTLMNVPFVSVCTLMSLNAGADLHITPQSLPEL